MIGKPLPPLTDYARDRMAKLARNAAQTNSLWFANNMLRYLAAELLGESELANALAEMAPRESVVWLDRTRPGVRLVRGDAS